MAWKGKYWGQTMIRFVPYSAFTAYPFEEMKRRAMEFREEMERRRTVRTFSSRSVPPGIVEDCLRSAGSAPSGANLQPWKFVVVENPELRRRIREGAEEVERRFYESASTRKWREDLVPLGTDASKPFLEAAPVLIAVFAETNRSFRGRGAAANPHAAESVCIALGFLFAALHHAGLAALCYTPSPPHFLRRILDRPADERPMCLVVAGFPADGVLVPDIARKRFDEIVEFV
jgi:nitroreductase